jgi:hypothetical protein
MKHLKLLKVGFGNEEFSMGYTKLILKVNLCGNSAAVEQFPKTVSNVIGDDEYTNKQSYSCDETALYYSLLPNKCTQQSQYGS